jgi:hypothetical protein
MFNQEVTFSFPNAPNTRSKNVLDLRLKSTISRHREWNASVTFVTSSDADTSRNGQPSDSANVWPENGKHIFNYIKQFVFNNFI